MESKIENSSRICPVPPGSKRGLNRHLRPRTIIIAVSLITILSTSALLNYMAQSAFSNYPRLESLWGMMKFDGNGVPPDFFNDTDIRKAFAYSIDYETIINEIYGGEARQPASPMIEGLPFHNPDQECYTYDLDMARQHFQQAWGGEVWNKGFNVILAFQGLSPMGSLWGTDKLAIAETIKNSIEAINTSFQVTVEPQYMVCWTSTSFCIDDHYPDPGLRYLSSQGNPDGGWLDGFAPIYKGYNDSAFDSLIEAGMNTVDPAERQAIYYELQRTYHENVIGIPLVQLLTRHYQRDWVWGWYHNPAAGMDFYEMLKGTCQDATRNIIAHIADLVDSGVLGTDAGSSLTETLENVIAFMDNGNLTEASQKLNDFIDQVNILELPVWDGEELIALAQEISRNLVSQLLTSELVPETDKLVCITPDYANSLEPTWYNPWLVSNCYDTLVSYERERLDRFRPLLVTEVPSLENGRISPDGLTYRFTIRNDSPLTSEDVEYSFERAMVRGRRGDTWMLREALLGSDTMNCWCNATGCYYGLNYDFEDIDNAVEAEGNDVVFHLPRIYPPFMHVLASSSFSILSKAQCVEAGDWPGTEERWESYINEGTPLDSATQGFGPFMLESLTYLGDYGGYSGPEIGEIVLVRNDDYWRGPARLKRVVIRLDEEWVTRKQKFLEGDADICSVPEENYTQLEGVEGIRVYTELPTLYYRGLFFNFATANNSLHIESSSSTSIPSSPTPNDDGFDMTMILLGGGGVALIVIALIVWKVKEK